MKNANATYSLTGYGKRRKRRAKVKHDRAKRDSRKKEKYQPPKYEPLPEEKEDEEKELSLLIEKPATPIYYDPQTGKYYYPTKTLKDEVASPPYVIIDKPKLHLDKRTKFYLDDISGNAFVQFNTPEEYKTLRKNMLGKAVAKDESIVAERTPIFFDLNKSKYYYPEIALGDRERVTRDIIKSKKVPLKYDRRNENFVHTQTGDIYIEVNEPKDFGKLRDELQVRLLEEDAEKFADLTPIYMHPDTEKIFYPNTATTEKELIPRMISVEIPPLFYDTKRKKFFDLSVGEEYLELSSEAEFESLRESNLKHLKQKEIQLIIDKSPVYYDKNQKKYFYPKIAFTESEVLNRKTLKISEPLRYNDQTDTFLGPDSSQEYLLVDSPSDFIKQRDIMQESIRNSKPIYYDEDRGIFYYPKVAVESLHDVELHEVVGVPPIKIDEKTGKITDTTSGEVYVAFKSQEEFKTERKKARRAHLRGNVKKEKEGSPIYFDNKENIWYYPESALNERIDTKRETVDNALPFKYNTKKKIYTHEETGEKYLAFKTEEEFKENWKTFQVANEKSKKIKFADDTPIYKDTSQNKYYYPRSALLDPQEIERKTIEVKGNPLMWNEDTMQWIHPGTEEIYIEFDNLKGYKKVKQEYISSETERIESEQKERVMKTPFYQDVNKFYYPQCALLEEKDYKREIIKGPHGLTFDPLLNSYTDPKTGEIYIEVANEAEFENQRGRALTENAMANLNIIPPIYFDAEENEYYYPKDGLSKRAELLRETVPMKPKQFNFNKKENIYVDNETGEDYIKVSDKAEYDYLKTTNLQSQEKETPTPETTELTIISPIIQNSKENKYYIPEVALLDSDSVNRETVEENGQLTYDAKLKRYTYLETNETYIEVKDLAEFENLRRQEQSKHVTTDKKDITDSVTRIKQDTVSNEQQLAVKERSLERLEPAKDSEVKLPLDTEEPKTTTASETVKEDTDSKDKFQLTAAKGRSMERLDQKKDSEVKLPQDTEEPKTTTESVIVKEDTDSKDKVQLTDAKERSMERLDQKKDSEVKLPQDTEESRTTTKSVIVKKDTDSKDKFQITENDKQSHESALKVEEIETLEHPSLRSISDPKLIETTEPTLTKKLSDNTAPSFPSLTTTEINRRNNLLNLRYVSAETPNYYDTKTGYFYYPLISTVENVNIPRQIIKGLPSRFIYDADKDIFFDPITFEKYARSVGERDVPKDLGKQRYEEIIRQRVEKTPIFHNSTTDEYFYPIIALNETDETDRPIIEISEPLTKVENIQKSSDDAANIPLTTEAADVLGAGSKTKMGSTRIDESNELIKETPSKTKVKSSTQLLLEDTTLKIEKTLSKDLDTDLFKEKIPSKETTEVVPKTESLKDTNIAEKSETDLPDKKESIKEIPAKGNVLTPITSNEKKPLKLSQEALPPNTTEPALGEKSAHEMKPLVFHNADKTKFYFPISAFENIPANEFVTLENQLKFDSQTNQYIDSETNEPYIEVNSPEEFDELRRKRLSEMRLSGGADSTVENEPISPIFHDETHNKYYYPETALTEFVPASRKIVPLESELIKEADTSDYIHHETKERYIEVENESEFQVLRMKAIDQPEATETVITPKPSSTQEKALDIQKQQSELSLSENLNSESDVDLDPIPELYRSSNGELYVKVRSTEEFYLERSNKVKKRLDYRRQKLAEQTPIYKDLSSGRYWYPKCGLDEPVFTSRKVFERQGELEWKEGIFYQIKTQESYVEVKNHEEFVILRRHQQEQLTPKPTWPYCTCEEQEPFIPSDDAERLAPSWEDELPRKCKNISHWDHLPNYIWPEIRTEKLPIDQMGDLLQKSKDLSFETPIYYDPINEFYYYPTIALMSESRAPRKIITQTILSLIYKVDQELFTDPSTSWNYVQVKSPVSFEKLRLDTRKLTFDQINRLKAHESPIYDDGSIYYYPKIALLERRSRNRQRSPDVDLVHYDDMIGEYQNEHGEFYILVDNENNFREKRATKFEERQKLFQKNYKSTPIYYDLGRKLFFFPMEALQGPEVPRTLILRKSAVMYNAGDRTYLDLTGKVYISLNCPQQFDSLKKKIPSGFKQPLETVPPPQVPERTKNKFKSLRKLLQENVDKLYENSPIYLNPFTDEFFYPFSAFSEVVETDHEILKTKPLLSFDSSKFLWKHAINDEPYIPIKNEEQFEQLRKELQAFIVTKSKDTLPVYD